MVRFKDVVAAGFFGGVGDGGDEVLEDFDSFDGGSGARWAPRGGVFAGTVGVVVVLNRGGGALESVDFGKAFAEHVVGFPVWGGRAGGGEGEETEGILQGGEEFDFFVG